MGLELEEEAFKENKNKVKGKKRRRNRMQSASTDFLFSHLPASYKGNVKDRE